MGPGRPGDDDAGVPREDDAGIVVPAPVLFLLATLAGVSAHYAWPLSIPILAPPTAWVVGVCVLALGIALATWTLLEFRRVGTTFRGDRPVRELVEKGPFRLSRNPLYLSVAVAQVGVGFLVDSLWVLLALVPAMLVISTLIVAPEEEYLERQFGDRYVRYKRSVRRWL